MTDLAARYWAVALAVAVVVAPAAVFAEPTGRLAIQWENYRHGQDLADVQRQIASLTDEHPDLVEAHYYLGVLAMDDRRWGEARDHLETFVEQSRGSPLRDAGRERAELIDEILELQDPDARTDRYATFLADRVRRARRDGDHRRAARLARRSHEQMPDQWELAALAAVGYATLGEHEEAGQLWGWALEAAPRPVKSDIADGLERHWRDGWIRDVVARAREATRDHDYRRAALRWEEAWDLTEGTDIDYGISAAGSWALTGRIEAARHLLVELWAHTREGTDGRRKLEQLAERVPQLQADSTVRSAARHYHRALRQLREGRHEEAIATANQALEVLDDAPALQILKARLWTELDQPRRTRRTLRQLDADGWPSGRWHLRAAELSNQIGDFEQAESMLETALEYDDDHGGYHREMGLALTGLEQFARAALAFSRSLELRPSSPPVLYRLGWAFAEAGDWQQATEAFEQAARLSPFQPSYRLDYVAALFRVGDEQAARNQIEILVEHGMTDPEEVNRWMDNL